MALAKIILLASLLGAQLKTIDKVVPTQLSGYVSAYDESPTIGTLAYRYGIGDIPEHKVPVYVVTLSCDHIGKRGILSTEAGDFHTIVFDCAGDDGGYSWMKENDIVVEVDYYFWIQYPEAIGKKAELLLLNER